MGDKMFKSEHSREVDREPSSVRVCGDLQRTIGLGSSERGNRMGGLRDGTYSIYFCPGGFPGCVADRYRIRRDRWRARGRR